MRHELLMVIRPLKSQTEYLEYVFWPSRHADLRQNLTVFQRRFLEPVPKSLILLADHPFDK